MGGGPGGPGGPGGMMRMLPIMIALDADKDGEISSSEIENAVAALKSLDKDKDGKLTEEELRPDFSSMPGGGPGRGGPSRGPEGPGRGPGGAAGPGASLDRLMAFDKNADGKLSKEEVPERIQSLIARADADKDGFASKAELEQMFAAQGDAAGEGPRGPGGRGPGGAGGGGGGRPQRPSSE